MNCSDIGKVVNEPELTQDNGVDKVTFTLSVENYRKNKTGEKVRNLDYFNFVAYHTGATSVYQRCKKGDLMWFDARPVQHRWEENGKQLSRIVFRLERFKIVQPVGKYEEDEDD